MNRAMAKPSPELLRNVGLFSALDDKDLTSLSDEFNERRFSPGETIALEGAGGLMFFVVDSGEASVDVHGEEVAWLGPGDSFGEVALIDRRPRTASVTAKTDLVTYALPVFVFRPFVEARRRVAGERDRLRPLDLALDASPEDDAADAGGCRTARDLARPLPRGRRLVHR